MNIPLDELIPAPWNPRRELQPGDIQWKQLEASIREHGLVDPLIVSHPSPWLKKQRKPKGYLIVGGHQRARVLAHLGIKALKVGSDVKLIALKSIKNEQRLAVALNRIEGEWDQDKLAQLLQKIKQGDVDDALGFTPQQLEELSAMLSQASENGQGDLPDHWGGMPEFFQADLAPWQQLIINFRNEGDREKFFQLVGQKLTENVRSIWYPEAEIEHAHDKAYIGAADLKYPVYVISKGRWKSPLTARALDKIGIPYHIVIEPQQEKEYAAVIDPNKILILPFSNLGQGSIPARNWVWEDSIKRGAERHWILDDNIQVFYRLHNNLKIPVMSPAIFRAAEEFTDRYENVGLSGFNYESFAPRKNEAPPFYLNTRIYSCILIQNSLPFRWRGVYNEDTDLSIRVLKYGYCTVLFNAFLQKKVTTMKMKGGNTDELYQGDGRQKMAESLKAQHPDVVRITQRFGRWQHLVNYKPFRKNKLRLKPGVEIPSGIENFGMQLEAKKQQGPESRAT